VKVGSAAGSGVGDVLGAAVAAEIAGSDDDAAAKQSVVGVETAEGLPVQPLPDEGRSPAA
jgi:hypothetical protein